MFLFHHVRYRTFSSFSKEHTHIWFVRTVKSLKYSWEPVMLGAWNKHKGDQYGRNVKNLNNIFLYTQYAQALLSTSGWEKKTNYFLRQSINICLLL